VSNFYCFSTQRRKAMQKQETRRCGTCKNYATMKCSRCKAVWYCSQSCQCANWDKHKSECADLAQQLKTLHVTFWCDEDRPQRRCKYFIVSWKLGRNPVQIIDVEIPYANNSPMNADNTGYYHKTVFETEIMPCVKSWGDEMLQVNVQADRQLDKAMIQSITKVEHVEVKVMGREQISQTITVFRQMALQL